MNDENVIKQKILEKADEMFRRFGFTKVTMEEIASNLGISKKTLYRHFSNKEHILKELVHVNKCEVDQFVETLMNDHETPFIEKLKSFMNFIAKISKRVEGDMIKDLMKTHPEVWRDIDEFRTNHAYRNLSYLIKEGIKDGIFRDDINNDVVVVAYVASIHTLINPETIAKLPVSADQAFKDVIKILFEGIFTTEGREKYHSVFSKNENNEEILI